MKHNNFIRLSDLNKSRLQNLKNHNSYNDLIGCMLDYFENSGLSPYYPVTTIEILNKLKTVENKINSVLIRPSNLVNLQRQITVLTECSSNYKIKSDTLKEILNRFLSEIEIHKSGNYYHIPKTVVENFYYKIEQLFFNESNETRL